MASSLAAAIKNNLGITTSLEEGHGGMFEVAIDSDIIYTNRSECGRLPGNEEILQRIKEYVGNPLQRSLHVNQKEKDKPIQGEKASTVCGCSISPMEAVPEWVNGCCTPSDEIYMEGVRSSCCSTESGTSNDIPSGKRRLDIEFMYLDLSVCTRCQGAETSLEEAVSEVAQVIEATGVEVVVHKINVQSEDQARELGFVSSPTIRINGRDIQLDVRESLCESCGDLCGEEVDCRVWVYQGKEYTVPPKAMIIEAILREVYGGTDKGTEVPARTVDVPENLKRFFAAGRK